MRDISKKLTIINTGERKEKTSGTSTAQTASYGGGGGGVAIGGGLYLPKATWDKVFEIKSTSSGEEYLFGKLPIALQYGLTMYVDGEMIELPSLAQGLPFDGRTIWYNPTTNQIEVIGGTGGGGEGGVSNFWDLNGIPSWITNSKPKYTYSEIEGTPDLSGFATQNWIISQGYASSEELKKYIPISGYTEVSGEKNFTGGLKVNGSPIYYDTEKKYWKLEGDLLVTGGVTMYGSDSSFTPSTIMDALLYDDTTLGINSNGQLYVKGGTSGGGLDITALQNYLTQNSYLNVTSGDNRYLQLSGGTINGTSPYPLVINTTETQSGIQFLSNNDLLGVIINGGEYGTALINFKGKYRALGIDNDGNAYTTIDYNNTKGILLHSANYSSYALPLSGGTLTNTLTIDNSNVGLILYRSGKATPYMRFGQDANNEWGELGVYHDGRLVFWPLVSSQGGYNQWNTVWHSGNDGSGSGLDADLLDGQHNGDLTAQYFSVGKILTSSDTINKLMSGVYCYINGNNPVGSVGSNAILLSFRNDGRTDMFQLANSANEHALYYRSAANIGNSYENWSSWKTIAFTDSNVASATYSPNTSKLYSTDNIYSYGSANPYYGYLTYNQTYNEWDFKVSPNTPEAIHVYSSDKLRTARTIWGQSFDGTGNVTGQLNITTGSNVTLTYGTGLLILGTMASAHIAIDTNDIQAKSNGTTASTLYLNDYGGNVSMCGNGGKVGIGTGSIAPQYLLDINTSLSTTYDIHYYNSSKKCSLYIGSSGFWYGNANTGNNQLVRIQGGTTSDGSGGIIALDLTGNGNLKVAGGITMYSDQRKKTILNHVELSLKQIAEAPLIEHYYNSDDKKTTHVGSIAQYWASMNDWFCKKDSEGYYTMEIQNAALASAISIARELDRYETKTDKAIKKLKKRICELEEEVERLKSA